jgi:hypothetical protein
MRVESALAGCHGLIDLPRVVDAIGGVPRFTELDTSRWLGAMGPRIGAKASAEVGMLGELPCIGLVVDDPAMSARRVASALARRNSAACCFLLDPAAEGLGITVATNPAPLLWVTLRAPERLAVAALRRVSGVLGGGRASTAMRVAEVLTGEGIDRRFFDAFRLARDRFAEEGPIGASLEERRSLALLDLTRVLFLYFVQHKGWLDGREDHLARAVDAHLTARRGLTRHLFHPLFFGTLNRPQSARSNTVRRFGRIPFLNGGLFEPHPLERRWRFIRSDAAWRDAFDTLFEHFHFTLDERGDGRAIAPDMLGKVFEGLMAPETRSATGSFYTPAPLVDKLVSAAIGSVLAERAGVDLDRAAELITAGDPVIAPILGRVRILDPAVGSGAFLLGAMELLTRIAAAGGEGPGIRRRVLKTQLYGIDLNAEAVRLAELRLWLAAVQDDPEGPDAGVDPLPNLDATLRQGDALHDPAWLRDIRRAPLHCARTLATARLAFAGASGDSKRAAWSALRRAETAAAAESMDRAVEVLESRIADRLMVARSPDLFGARTGLDRRSCEDLRHLRSDRRRVREAAKHLGREGALPWFDAQSAFGEVFADRGGFDLVIGNPPWVRGEAIPRTTRGVLAARYRWWGGEGRFAHPPDLAVAFLERGLELTAPSGVLAMLVPAKVATAGYGRLLRTALTTETSLDRVVDLTESESDAFAAVTYPLAIVTRKRKPDAEVRTRLGLTGGGTTSTSALTGAPWILRSPDAGALAAELKGRFPKLGESFPIHLGVKSGLNAAFLDPPAGIESALIRPALRGRGVSAFRVGELTPLLYPHDRSGVPLRSLPERAAAYLRTHRGALERRSDRTRGAWWALHRTIPASARFRVAWADVARRLEAVVVPQEVVPLNSCYFAIAPDREALLALTAWLNSTSVRALASLGADPARGGFARFNARIVGALPWVPSAAADQRLAEAALAVERSSKVPHAIPAIDAIVADHLGLGRRERHILSALG